MVIIDLISDDLTTPARGSLYTGGIRSLAFLGLETLTIKSILRLGGG